MNFKIDTDAKRQGFQHPHYILVNTAIAPTIEPGPTANTLPQKYYIDYVRVYQRGK